MRNNSSRKQGRRQFRKRILIVVGGEATERNYFEKLAEEINTPERRVDVKVVPCGKDPLRVVQQAVKLKNDEVPDETWVVFDKDDFGDKFDNAIRETETAEMKVAPSNACFELWFLLHFQDVQGPLDRRRIFQKFKNIQKKTYKKNDPGHYEFLKDNGDEPRAIRRAEQLREQADNKWDNPTTGVYLLLQRLRGIENSRSN